MLYSYYECLEKFRNDYQIKKELAEENLFLLEKGVYSDKKHVSELEIIIKKYPNTVLTLYSAFYYHGLTDTIPQYYYMATAKNRRKITDPRVKQIYENSMALELGRIEMEYEGVTVPVYCKERMLIELIRNRRKIPFDLYKELIASYRNMTDRLDMALVSDYAYELPKFRMIMDALRREVL